MLHKMKNRHCHFISLFRCASISSTYPCLSVRRLVTLFQCSQFSFNFLTFSSTFSLFPQLYQFFFSTLSVFPQISHFLLNFIGFFSSTFSVFPQLSQFFLNSLKFFFNFLSFSSAFSAFPQLSQFFFNYLSFPQLSQFFLNLLSFSSTFLVFLNFLRYSLNFISFFLNVLSLCSTFSALLKHRKVASFTPWFAFNIPYVPRLRAHQYLNRYCMLLFEIHATQK